MILKIDKEVEQINQINSEIYKLLSANDEFGQKICSIENAVFSKIKLKDSFVAVMDEYNAFLDELKSADKINTWVSDKTKNLIKEVVDQKIINDSIIIIISTLYFKADWLFKFDKNYSYKDIFYNKNGEIKTKFMTNRLTTKSTQYYKDKYVQSIKLPLKTQDFSVLIILPNKNIDIISKLGSEYLEKIKNGNIEEGKITLSMPLFDLDASYQMIDRFMDMGINLDCVDKLCNEDVSVNKIIHKIKLTINDEGVEAAAATIISLRDITSSTTKEKNYLMKVNRPFIFCIMHEKLNNFLIISYILNII